MRKTSTLAVLLTTFILCLGLACCSSEEAKTRDEIFDFNHNDVIKENTTSTQQSTEENTQKHTEETESEESTEQESDSAVTTTVKRTTVVFRTTLPTTAPTTAAPTTAATTLPPTTKTPVTTSPPDIEYRTTQRTTAPIVNDEEDAALESEVLRLANLERDKKGLSSLTYSKELAAAADIRARELATSFSHNRPDGTTCFTVSELVFGENIAMGQSSPSSVINSWMNSQGHKDNILNENFKISAIGYYNDGETHYWVQLFGY